MRGDGDRPDDDRPESCSDGRSPDRRLVADGDSSGSQLFDAFPDPLLCYEVEEDAAVVRAVNPAFERTFDVDEATVTGDSLTDHLLVDADEVELGPGGRAGPTDAPGTEDDGRAAIETTAREVVSRLDEGEQVTIVTRRGADGGQRHFRLEAVPVVGGTTGNGVVYIEATGLRRQVWELETRVERLERFIGVAAHDLRNPLDVANIRLEAARDTGEDVHFEKVQAAHDRIQDIIQNVLSVGGADVDPSEEVSLDAVAEAAWSTVDTGAATLVLEDDLPTIEADADLLQQAFENLFRNSVEHGSTSSRPEADAVEHGRDVMEHDGHDVTVTVGGLSDVSASEEQGSSTDEFGGFYVEDDGPGIPSEEREQVFDPGYSTADDNTGLGLAIVKQIADDHGWRVTLSSGDAGGARFEFTGVVIESPA